MATLRRTQLLSFSLAAVALASALAGGCGSSKSASTTTSTGTTSGGNGGSSGTGGGSGCFDYTTFDGTSPTQSFKNDVLPIFLTNCAISSSCHSSNPPPTLSQQYLGPEQGTATSADIAAILAGTVGVASIDEPDMDVIKASDPEHSFMMYKLDGLTCSTLECSANDTCLTTMPLGSPLLALDQRNIIRRWIAQGALNN